jgi:hypothetical protein
MARHQREERPVTESEFEQFPERIRAHFDRVREALDDALSGE